jgi:hypothetical protein
MKFHTIGRAVRVQGKMAVFLVCYSAAFARCAASLADGLAKGVCDNSIPLTSVAKARLIVHGLRHA